MTRMTYFFDGGCRPNPGPIEIAVVRGGVVSIRDGLGPGDNNEAEWLALLFAIELAAADATDVLFVGDSVLVVEQARGRRPCRSAHLRPYLERYRAAVAGFDRVRLRQVPRARNLAGIALARRGLP